jgi:hypothetical protein
MDKGPSKNTGLTCENAPIRAMKLFDLNHLSGQAPAGLWQGLSQGRCEYRGLAASSAREAATSGDLLEPCPAPERQGLSTEASNETPTAQVAVAPCCGAE